MSMWWCHFSKARLAFRTDQIHRAPVRASEAEASGVNVKMALGPATCRDEFPAACHPGSGQACHRFEPKRLRLAPAPALVPISLQLNEFGEACPSSPRVDQSSAVGNCPITALAWQWQPVENPLSAALWEGALSVRDSRLGIGVGCAILMHEPTVGVRAH
jgi:hypothetical protein